METSMSHLKVGDEDPNEVDNRYMRLAWAQACKSKEPFKVGSCVVNLQGLVLSVGHNRVILPNLLNQALQSKKGPTYRYMFTDLAIEAALNSPYNFNGSTVYQTTFPTRSCVKEMIKKGVIRVVHYQDKREELVKENLYAEVEEMLKEAGIEQRPFNLNDEDEKTKLKRQAVLKMMDEEKLRTHSFDRGLE